MRNYRTGEMMPLPPTVVEPQIAQAKREHDRLLGEQATARVDLDRAQRERDVAVEADRRALIDASAAGKPDPGTKQTDRADERIAGLQRRLDGLTGAVQDAESAVLAAVEAHRENWTALADSNVERARKQVANAVEALRVALRERSNALGERNFIADRGTRGVKPGGPYALHLNGQRHEPTPIPTILDALAALAEPPAEPAPPPQHVPPGAQQARLGQRDPFARRDPVVSGQPSAAITLGQDDYLGRPTRDGWAA